MAAGAGHPDQLKRYVWDRARAERPPLSAEEHYLDLGATRNPDEANETVEDQINVRGATLKHVQVGGDVDAAVRITTNKAERDVPSAIADLVGALEREGLLRYPELARAAEGLTVAADPDDETWAAVRGILARIERHPALAQGAPGAVAAALTALQLATG